MKKIISTLFIVTFSITMGAQSNWHPISSWPFVYELFQDAVIYSGPSNVRINAKANIHVGKSTLWYESKGSKLEAKQGTVNKVIFPDSTVYYNISDKLCAVLSEDTINGKLCRLYVCEQVDKHLFDEMVRSNMQTNMAVFDIAPALADFASGVADNEGIKDVEHEPLPMYNRFFMLYEGELFEVNEGNILKHLTSKEERNAYRSFTRSAEVMYGSKQSMLDVWKAFFVK